MFVVFLVGVGVGGGGEHYWWGGGGRVQHSMAQEEDTLWLQTKLDAALCKTELRVRVEGK